MGDDVSPFYVRYENWLAPNTDMYCIYTHLLWFVLAIFLLYALLFHEKLDRKVWERGQELKDWVCQQCWVTSLLLVFEPRSKTNRASSPLPPAFVHPVKTTLDAAQNPTTPTPCRWLVGILLISVFVYFIHLFLRTTSEHRDVLFWQPSYGADS